MLKLKLQYFVSLMQTADSLEVSWMLGKIEGRRRRGHQRIRWLDGITGCSSRCNGHELEQTSGDVEEQGGLACCSPWSCKESDMTGRLKVKSVYALTQQFHLQEFALWICLQTWEVACVLVTQCSFVWEKQIEFATILIRN